MKFLKKLALLGLAALAGLGAIELRAREIICLPFNESAGQGEWIFVGLEFTNGQRGVFAVDTGTPVTVLDRSWARLLGKKAGALRAAFPLLKSAFTADIYPAARLTCGGEQLRTGRYILCADLHKALAGAVTNRCLDGILGLDCFEGRRVCFDFKRHEIQMFDAQSAMDPDWGAGFPLALHKSWLRRRGMGNDAAMVTMDVGGNRGLRLTVDTGFLGDGMLTEKPMERALRNFREDYRTGALPKTEGYGIPFEKLLCGGRVYPHVVLVNYRQNLLGLGILARNDVLLDFPAKTLYLRPAQR